jgi:hypothetical protein
LDQSSTLRPDTAFKSVSFDTTVQLPTLNAIAAIWMSIICILRPVRRNPANILPNSIAAARSKAHNCELGYVPPQGGKMTRRVIGILNASDKFPEDRSAETHAITALPRLFDARRHLTAPVDEVACDPAVQQISGHLASL